jgi:hypothetical protein
MPNVTNAVKLFRFHSFFNAGSFKSIYVPHSYTPGEYNYISTSQEWHEEVQLKQTAARLTIVLPTAANENQRKCK